MAAALASASERALALASVMIAVPDVEEAAQRFVRFSGRPARASALGQIIELDRGRIDLVRSEAFAQLLPELAAPSLPFIGAYMILVRSLAVVEDIFAKADLPTRRMGQALVAVFLARLDAERGFSRRPPPPERSRFREPRRYVTALNMTRALFHLLNGFEIVARVFDVVERNGVELLELYEFVAFLPRPVGDLGGVGRARRLDSGLVSNPGIL